MKIMRAGLIALVFAGLLATTNQLTYSDIADNKTAYANRKIAEMIDGREFRQTDSGFDFFEAGELVGQIKTVVTPHGYNGDIQMLVAFDLTHRVISVRVTDHRETPGLGDAIDKEWIKTFDGRTADTNWSLAPAGDIDGITGATITARAVAEAVGEVVTQ